MKVGTSSLKQNKTLFQLLEAQITHTDDVYIIA